jgi:hypothetical protein
LLACLLEEGRQLVVLTDHPVEAILCPGQVGLELVGSGRGLTETTTQEGDLLLERGHHFAKLCGVIVLASFVHGYLLALGRLRSVYE